MGRYLRLSLLLVLAALAVACGSSSTTVVSPSDSDRCTVTVAATTTTVGATGGSGSVTINTARECQWTATADAAWLTLPSGASGQGPNTISYEAAANATSASRRASISVNGQRVEILQEGASSSCAVSLPQRTFAVGASGGTVQVPLTAQSSCTWSAASRATWIVVTSSNNGSGDSAIVLAVAANTGASRSAIVDIGGQEATVTQAAAPAGCSFGIDPGSSTVGADPSPVTVAVTASANCAWAAISESPWIAVTSGAAGAGNGSVVLQVAANSGAFRVGTVTIAGRSFNVTQSAAPAACSYAVAPASQNVPAAGGSTSATVSASSGCAWSTTGVPAWISVTGGSGNGNGTVNFTAQPNTGAARTATMTVAGQSFTINQAAGAAPSCTFTLNPTSHSPTAAGGATSVAVTTAAGCSWSTTGLPAWITFTSGNGTGTGNGTVNLTVAANTGAARNATLTIAGQAFSVNQAAASPSCTYSLNPTSFSAAAAGGPTTVAVTTTSGCSWTTTGVPTWITVVNNSGAGSGNGTVSLQISANTGAARSATLTIAGQSYTVNQAAAPACSFTLNPTSYSASAVGGSTSVAVTTASGCSWSTTGLPAWITYTSGNGTGTGNGSVNIAVQINTGAARSATLTIAGQQFTVSQAAVLPCSYTVSPETVNVDKNAHTGAGAVSIGIQTTSLCTWTAAVTSGSSWLSIRSGASGSGNGTTLVDVQANDGPARTGTLTIAGRTVTITQEKK